MVIANTYIDPFSYPKPDEWSPPDNLRAVLEDRRGGGLRAYVSDSFGGRWYPDESALDDIREADSRGEGGLEAIRICDMEPHRGRWRS